MPIRKVYSNTSDYYNICVRFSRRLSELDEQVTDLERDPEVGARVQSHQLHNERRLFEAIVIVFAALCAEWCAAPTPGETDSRTR